MTVQRTPETNFEVMILILNSKKKNHFFNSKIAINIELLETAMAAHSSALAWKIPWTEEPGGLQSMGSLRVGHD